MNAYVLLRAFTWFSRRKTRSILGEGARVDFTGCPGGGSKQPQVAAAANGERKSGIETRFLALNTTIFS